MSLRVILTGRASTIALAVLTLLATSALGANKYKVLHTFGSGKDGSVPFGPLTLDAKGNLYGSTSAGGGLGCEGSGCGTVFRLTQRPNGKWSEEALHNFADSGDGAGPSGNLVLDRFGNYTVRWTEPGPPKPRCSS